MDGYQYKEFHVRGDSARDPARRVQHLIHPMDDIVFDPLAKPGNADYGNLYVSMGDGGSGRNAGTHSHHSRNQLNALQGKILRITPNLTLRPKDMLSENGRYRIPSTGADPNPFISVAGARPEIFAYGLRNPQRMDWDAINNTLLVNDIGLHSWEEVNIVTKGGNYGYAEREGNELLIVAGGGKTGTQFNPADSISATGCAHRRGPGKTCRANLSRGGV